MNRPLRIGIEVQRLFRAKKHGMEVVALELLKELQHLDKYNEYVVFVKKDVDVQCLQPTDNFKIEIISSLSYIDWEQYELPKAVKRHNLDFLHSTCNTSSFNLSVPLILTLHDIIYLEKLDFKGTAYQNFGNLYRKIIVPAVVRKSKVIITVSNFEKDVIKKRLNVADQNIVVIYNAVNKKFNNNYSGNEIEEFKRKFNLPAKFILFLGNTAPKKNTYNVISSFISYCRSASSIVPIVILDYNKGLVEDILSKAGASDLISYFFFPGFISSDEMPLMYNSAFLFLYPSVRESFGLPILEAMACNTPVITSSTSCMPEIAGDAALLVDPLNITSISEGIVRLLDDVHLRETLKLKGLNRAKRFSWRSAAKELLDVYGKFNDLKN